MAGRPSQPLYLVYDEKGTSYTKLIRYQSGKPFVMHNGQVVDVRVIGYESLSTEQSVVQSGKPIYLMIGEYSLQKTL